MSNPGARPGVAAGHAWAGAGRAQPERSRRGPSLYERLLAVEPEGSRGAERYGLAGRWPNRNREEARAGFRRCSTIEPDNEEAKIGLSKSPDVYRYLLETSGLDGFDVTGHVVGLRRAGRPASTPFDTLELGWLHFSDECRRCRSWSLTLPSHDLTVGYHRLVPLSYAVSLVYDYREYSTQPTEHWLTAASTVYVTDRLRGSALTGGVWRRPVQRPTDSQRGSPPPSRPPGR